MPKKADNKAFDVEVFEELRGAKIIGIRSGSEHKFTGVWPVMVDNRLFARSWNDKPTGWFRAFRKERRGTLQVGKFEVLIEAKLVRSAKIRDAVTRAYAEKYNTNASQKWIEGFAEPEREANTIEFVPR